MEFAGERARDAFNLRNLKERAARAAASPGLLPLPLRPAEKRLRLGREQKRFDAGDRFEYQNRVFVNWPKTIRVSEHISLVP